MADPMAYVATLAQRPGVRIASLGGFQDSCGSEMSAENNFNNLSV